MTLLINSYYKLKQIVKLWIQYRTRPTLPCIHFKLLTACLLSNAVLIPPFSLTANDNQELAVETLNDNNQSNKKYLCQTKDNSCLSLRKKQVCLQHHYKGSICQLCPYKEFISLQWLSCMLKIKEHQRLLFVLNDICSRCPRDIFFSARFV